MVKVFYSLFSWFQFFFYHFAQGLVELQCCDRSQFLRYNNRSEKPWLAAVGLSRSFLMLASPERQRK